MAEQGSPVSLNQDSPRESKAEFSALLIQPVGLAGSWKGAVSVKEHQFPHPSPRHHSWEVRLEEAWSYKKRGGARGRGMFLHSSLCRGGERWGDFPFHPSPSPAEQQVSHALLAGGELPGWDGAAEGLEYFLHCSHTHFHLCHAGGEQD